MPKRIQHLDHHLGKWPFVPGQPLVREVIGVDGRSLLQIRVDLGILQLEKQGRPDGAKPGGFDTYYDYLVSLAFKEGETFQLDEERCVEVDREFYQFYHRRICWLTLNRFSEAVSDAEHTLALMNFSEAYAPTPEWAMLHEQYRPFVLFHKFQSLALQELENSQPRAAVDAIDDGLKSLAKVFETHHAEDQFEEDPFVEKFSDMRTSIVEHYELGQSLAEQLEEAIATEQYELAAELRDRLMDDSEE